MYRRYLKRVFDCVLATLGLICLAPLLLLTALAIRLEDGGPALFRQRRVGRGGAIFTFFKFRSMPVDTGDVPSAEATGLRITRIGRILRRTNIDELPQLFNVLRGDMSIVGPRPPLPSQTRLIDFRRENGALDCLPGLSGLAQINAYDQMPTEEKANWDGRYAARISFLGDLLIILNTCRFVLKKPPVY